MPSFQGRLSMRLEVCRTVDRGRWPMRMVGEAWWSERGSGGHPVAKVSDGTVDEVRDVVEEVAAPCSASEELGESAEK
jgi:hypothetical protein